MLHSLRSRRSKEVGALGVGTTGVDLALGRNKLQANVAGAWPREPTYMARKDKLTAWKDHLDKAGIAGSFVAGACCMGLPAVLSIMGAVGLGFLIQMRFLIPLMVAFLGLTLVGLFLGYRVHRRPWALVLGGISSVVAFFFIFVQTIKFVGYLAIAGLVVASVLNAVLRRKCAPACEA